jgi:predicted secreted protein
MQKISLKAGEKKIIQVPDLSTAGYSLTFSGNYELIIKVERPVQYRKNDIKIAGGTKKISFEITALKTGKASLMFQQKRSWEQSATAANEWLYEITVE